MNREVTTKYKTQMGSVFLTEQEIGILELLNSERYVYVDGKNNPELFDKVFNLYTRQLLIRVSIPPEREEIGKSPFSIDYKGGLIFSSEEYKKREKKNNRNKIIDNILR